MRVLFLTTLLPARKLHGSEVASQNIIDGLQRNGCEVTVLGYGRKEDGECQPAKNEILVAERSVETKEAKLQAIFWLLLSMLKRLPYSSTKYISKQYVNRLKSLLGENRYDAIVIDHSQLGWLLKFINPRQKIIMIAHNIEYEMYLQHARNADHWLTKLIYQREATSINNLEQLLATKVTEIWALTEHDANHFARLAQSNKARALSLPSGFATTHNQDVEKQFDVGIIGSWAWMPNEEGLRWFLAEVYPHIPTHISIHVAGRGAEWLRDKYPNVTYRGFVPDAQAFMAEARVVAIPTLSGGGIQIKTLDAITAGARIVATPVAMRGIEHPPQTVTVTASPQEFAQLLDDVVTSPESQSTYATAQKWYRDREEQFLGEIGQAIAALKQPPSSTTANIAISRKG
jgi:polysaccharide biosynthesis protein PslH